MTLLICSTLGAGLIGWFLYSSLKSATIYGGWLHWSGVVIQSICLAFQILNMLNAIQRLN